MRKLLSLLFITTALSCFSQQSQVPTLSIKKAIDKIVLDGDLTEKSWESAEIAGNFKQIFPFDTSFAKTKTDVRVTYDDYYLYA